MEDKSDKMAVLHIYIILLNQILEVIIDYIGKIRFNIVYTHGCITKKALIQLGRCNMGF